MDNELLKLIIVNQSPKLSSFNILIIIKKIIKKDMLIIIYKVTLVVKVFK